MNRAPISDRDQAARQADTELELDSSFWRFAVRHYGKPGVAEALLTLQDEAGVDVVHALLMTFVHRIRGHSLATGDIADSRTAMSDWREIAVLPLRQLRRNLKAAQPRSAAETLRQSVKKAELLAEQIQISMAERWLSGRETAPGLPLKEGLVLLVSQYSGINPCNEQSLSAAIDTIVKAVDEIA